MIRSPTFSPAAPTKTPPPSFVPPAVKRSTLGPRLPARRWLRNHACRRPSLNPSRLSLFHRRQVDGAPGRLTAKFDRLQKPATSWVGRDFLAIPDTVQDIIAELPVDRIAAS